MPTQAVPSADRGYIGHTPEPEPRCAHAGLVFKRFTPLRRPIYGDPFSQFGVKGQVVFVTEPSGIQGRGMPEGGGMPVLKTDGACWKIVRPGERRGEHLWVPRP